MSGTTPPAFTRPDTSDVCISEAARHLERLGYQVLARSYREADLIAAADDRLVVRGVRTQRSPGLPSDHPGGLARRRLWRSAAAWLQQRDSLPWRSVRFDLIVVYVNGAGEPVALDHTPDAF